MQGLCFFRTEGGEKSVLVVPCSATTAVTAGIVASTGRTARVTAIGIAGATTLCGSTLRLQLGNCRSYGLQGLNLAALALDGNLLGVYNVAELQCAGVLEGRAAQIVQLGAVRQEADVDSLHHIIGVQPLHSRNVLYGSALGHLGRGIESAQRAQLHRYALCQQLGQADNNLVQHALYDVARVKTVVLCHVLGKTAQRERLLHINLGIILTEACAVGILILSKINTHHNVLCSH